MAPKSRENGLKVWKHKWDKGEPSLPKIFFRPFRPHFDLKGVYLFVTANMKVIKTQSEPNPSYFAK